MQCTVLVVFVAMNIHGKSLTKQLVILDNFQMQKTNIFKENVSRNSSHIFIFFSKIV